MQRTPRSKAPAKTNRPTTRAQSRDEGSSTSRGSAEPTSTSTKAMMTLMGHMVTFMKDFQNRQADENKARHEEMKELIEKVSSASASQREGDAAPLSTSTQDLPARTTHSKVPEPNKPPLLASSISLDEFDSWRATWSDYAACFQFNLLPPAQQMARFRTFLTSEMRSELTHAIGISDHDVVTPSECLDRIRAHIRSRRNVALDRVAFEDRKQEVGESFDDFYISLRKTAANADMCQQCLDQRITTRLMAGILDKEVKRKLLALKPFPTCQQAVDLCRSEETARANEATLGASAVESTSINRVARTRKTPPKGAKANKGQRFVRQPTNQRAQECNYCGGERHPRARCPALGQTCSRCRKMGHFGKVCRSGKTADHTKAITKVELHVSSTSKYGRDRKAPKVQVDLYLPQGQRRLASQIVTPDSAAEATIAGAHVLKELGLSKHSLASPQHVSLVVANQSKMKCIGAADLVFKFWGRTTKDTVYFCEGHRGMLLSWFASKDVGILPPDYPAPVKVESTLPARRVDSVEAPSPGPHTPRVNDVQRFSEVIGVCPDAPTSKQKADIRQALLKEFADVFSDATELRKMDCPALKIELTKDAKPFSIRVPRAIPLPVQAEAKKELDTLVSKRVIAEVPSEEPSEWCHPIVCAKKKDKSIRLCVDLTQLNPYVVRPFHPLPTPKQAVSSIPNGMKYFSVFDAKKGYWQMELDAESQKLTTFLTPWGRYKFLRAPMGLTSTGDAFCYHGDKALIDIGNIQKVVDDSIEYDPDFATHAKRVWVTLERCREKNITLNAKKFQFAKDTVEFCGYIVSTKGIHADPEKVKAIAAFPPPKNLTELRSFFGMINQLGAFTKDVSQTAEPLRPLLSSKNAYLWLPEHDAAFTATKKALSSPPILSSFELGCETVLHTDASRRNGLGFVLLQKQQDQWRLIECGSRFLTDTESRYATIELEMLAVVWATTQKLNLYLQGLPAYKVVVDHRPLVPILNKQVLSDVQNPRLRNLKEKLAGYVFEATWRKGKEHCIPDALSRAPVDMPDDDVYNLEKDVNALTVTESADRELCEDHDPLSVQVKAAAQGDAEYRSLCKAIEEGFPSCPVGHLAHFAKLQATLYVSEGLAMLGPRIIIPSSIRRDVLKRLHSSHQGVEKTKRRARQCVYWPGINADIKNVIQTCQACQLHQPSQQKETIVSDPRPQWVFQEVATDLFSHAGKHYLVYVDRLSGWPSVYNFGKSSPSAKQVIKAIRRFFADLGVPQKLRSDNGPQFAAAEFKKFLTRWEVTLQTSSPHFPSSNGLAEAAVKAVKLIVAKTTTNGDLDSDEFGKALLEYRNTPRASGASPAEMLFGHILRSHVPAHRSLFAPRWGEVMDSADRRSAELKHASDLYYNQRAKDLAPLKIGDSVFVQSATTGKWDVVGRVTGLVRHRDYLIKLPSGRIQRRNRRFLRPTKLEAYDEDV